LAAEYHPGQGKMGGVTHARLKNLATGTQWEHSFRADLRLEEVPLDRRPMDFLYSDESTCYFMDPESCEQAEIPVSVVGDGSRFLLPEMRLSVEFVNDTPVSVLFPDFMEVRVADTAPPVHQSGQDNTWKQARLENGVQVMVPQFIRTGDVIRYDLANQKYMDRAKSSAR
jgi:elongation factor P